MLSPPTSQTLENVKVMLGRKLGREWQTLFQVRLGWELGERVKRPSMSLSTDDDEWLTFISEQHMQRIMPIQKYPQQLPCLL